MNSNMKKLEESSYPAEFTYRTPTEFCSQSENRMKCMGKKKNHRGNSLANTYKINLNACPNMINLRLDLKFTDV